MFNDAATAADSGECSSLPVQVTNNRPTTISRSFSGRLAGALFYDDLHLKRTPEGMWKWSGKRNSWVYHPFPVINGGKFKWTR